MCIAVVAAQVFNVRVVVFLEAIVSHETTVIAVNVSVSSCTIDMVMQSLGWTATCTCSCNILRGKSRFLWSETTAFSLLGWEVSGSITSHVEVYVCVSASAVCVVDPGGSRFSQNAAHVAKFSILL